MPINPFLSCIARFNSTNLFNSTFNLFSNIGNSFLEYMLLRPLKNLSKWIRNTTSSNLKLIIFGLRGSGKTTLMYRLKLGNFIHTIPSQCCIQECFQLDLDNSSQPISICAYDLTLDMLYSTENRDLLKTAKRFIYVVDSSDKWRIKDAADQLQSFFYYHGLLSSGEKILILANKKDIRNAMTDSEINDILDLPISTNSNWKIFPCSTLTGTGLEEAIDWLFKSVFEDAERRYYSLKSLHKSDLIQI